MGLADCRNRSCREWQLLKSALKFTDEPPSAVAMMPCTSPMARPWRPILAVRHDVDIVPVDDPIGIRKRSYRAQSSVAVSVEGLSMSAFRGWFRPHERPTRGAASVHVAPNVSPIRVYPYRTNSPYPSTSHALIKRLLRCRAGLILNSSRACPSAQQGGRPGDTGRLS